MSARDIFTACAFTRELLIAQSKVRRAAEAHSKRGSSGLEASPRNQGGRYARTAGRSPGMAAGSGRLIASPVSFARTNSAADCIGQVMVSSKRPSRTSNAALARPESAKPAGCPKFGIRFRTIPWPWPPITEKLGSKSYVGKSAFYADCMT